MSTLKVESLRHYDADSDALTLSSSGTITFNGTLVGVTDSAQVQSQFDSAFPSAFDTRFALQDTHDSAAVQAQIDSAAVTLTGNQTVAGIKTFSDSAVFSGVAQANNFIIPNGYAYRAYQNDGTFDNVIYYSNLNEVFFGRDNREINFRTNTSIRATIDSDGNFGIGANSPDSKLHVSGSFRQTGATAPFEWTVNPGAADYYKLNAVGYADNLIVANSSGNVSIGTTVAGSPGLGVATGKNMGFVQANGESLANSFRQNTSGAYVLSQGYQYSSSTNGWASSFGSSLARSAIWLGNTIRFYVDTAATVSVGTDITPTERVRIDTDGLKFNGDTAAANALDDYEEGTWDPRPSTSNSSLSLFSGLTLNAYTGRYQKVGGWVHVQYYIEWSGTSSSTSQVFMILPFTCAGYWCGTAIETSKVDFPTGTSYITVRPEANNSYATFKACGDNIGRVNMTGNTMFATAGGYTLGTFTYPVA